ncbi:glycerol-3-phosphate 1-O-acyltransferase PlsY [Guggenheimella bovis]
MNVFISGLLSYLYGSLPTAYLIGKIFGQVDLRKVGSGNLGTTNVARVLGIPLGVLNFLLDISKGIVPFLLARHFFGYDIGVLCGVLGVFGHCYSIFLGFRGGKGVATSFGLILFSDYRVAIVLVILQVSILLITRLMSMASIITASSFPFIALLVKSPRSLVWAALVLSPFVLYRHKDNFKRLREKREKPLF